MLSSVWLTLSATPSQQNAQLAKLFRVDGIWQYHYMFDQVRMIEAQVEDGEVRGNETCSEQLRFEPVAAPHLRTASAFGGDLQGQDGVGRSSHRITPNMVN